MVTPNFERINQYLITMKYYLALLFSLFFLFQIEGQSELRITENSFQINDLQDKRFKEFTTNKLNNTQFVFIGEQHGIAEVGIFTNALYNLSQPFNYKTLCIETDALAARKITDIAKSENAVDTARKFYEEFPFSIPFYNNSNDYALFKNVVSKGGDIWGIDQTFMVQFRMNFDYLIKNSSNKAFKNKLQKLKEEAIKSYNNSIESKDFSANYIFKYDEQTHKELVSLSTTDEAREILYQFWKTKEIYAYYNISKEYFKNNNVRAQLMKRNFMRYYNANNKETLPKVIFKLGANHAARGLTRTHVFDIANLGSELAESNGLKSLNYMVMGISGEVAVGNPFAPNPTMPFDNVKQFPKEIKDVIPSISKKYYVLDLAPLRNYAYGKRYTEAFKKIIFAYDVIVLVKDAKANKTF